MSHGHGFDGRGSFGSAKDRAQLSGEPKSDAPADEAERAEIRRVTQRDGQIHPIVPGPIGAFFQAFFSHGGQPAIVE